MKDVIIILILYLTYIKTYFIPHLCTSRLGLSTLEYICIYIEKISTADVRKILSIYSGNQDAILRYN